jgi:TonB-dependent starch-binding outer membrane protein SusC
MKELELFEKKSFYGILSKKILLILKLTFLFSVVINFAANGKSKSKFTVDRHEVAAVNHKADNPSGINALTDLQQLRITGTVNDEKGNPVTGVTVLVKGTTTGSLTDASGKYSLSNVPQNATLVFSFVGMQTQEIAVNNRTLIDVVLKEEAIGLEEVVVVGYGTQRKVTLTGSVTSVANKELKSSPVLNISSAISGLLPGVISNNRTGEPGRDNNTVYIRGRSTTGDNSPLVVVDGIQGYSGWQRINSNDIESISVLKDASAAIYGARAANGVILITTKRGATGKPTISYTFNQGISQPTRVPKLCNSGLYAEYVNEVYTRQGQLPKFTAAEVQKFKDHSDPLNYPDTDWFGEVLKKYTTQSQHNLNVRGGSDNIKYSISGSMSNEGSIYKNGSLNFRTYSLRSNLDAMITRNIKVGFDLNSAIEDGDYPAYSTGSIFSNLWQTPWIPVYWKNGLPSPGIENGQNPIVMCTTETGNYNNKVERNSFKPSFDISIPWVKGLGIDGYYIYTKNETVVKNWQKPWTVYDYDKATDTYIPKLGGGILLPQLTQSSTISTNNLVNLRLKYETQLASHHISTFVAVEQSSYTSSFFQAFRKNYISTTIDELFAGSLTDQKTDGNTSKSGRKNLFGRLSYGYKDKYLIDINVRYDGSSNFPKGKQWGFFPGVSLGYRISQENFMSSLDFIDNLKLRASIGKIGNDAIAAFQYLNLYTIGSAGYSFGATPTLTQGLVAGVSPNPNVTWEELTTSNVGLDLGLWKGLINLEVDFFKQRRSNILATRDLAVPYFTGLNLPSENIGVVENSGFELQISHAKTINGFLYKVSGNLAYAHSNVIDVSEPATTYEWQKAQGHPLGSTLYYVSRGISRTQADVDNAPFYGGTKVGDLTYYDMDGDNKITANDRVRLGKTSTPEITFGLNLSAEYKRFTLWANFAGQAKAWMFYKEDGRLAINGLASIVENRYTTGSMTSKYPWIPILQDYSEPSALQSTFWLWSAAFVRLKTLELSYSLPESLLSKVKIQSLRIFVNGNNLFTIDKLKLYDPENTNNYGQYYPQSKIYNVGINISF